MDRWSSAEIVLRQAFHLHQQGKFIEAELLYRTVLQVDPDSAVAHHFARQQPLGRSDRALRKSHCRHTGLDRVSDAHGNLGLALESLGPHRRGDASL
jgi:hypothetical protein